MLAVVLVGERCAAVVAGSDFGLVGIDVDFRVTVIDATATVANNHSVVSPSNWLLVDHFHRRERLRLKLEVCLLESGASHGSGSGFLVSGPDLHAVGSLANLDGYGVAGLSRSLELVPCRRHC